MFMFLLSSSSQLKDYIEVCGGPHHCTQKNKYM